MTTASCPLATALWGARFAGVWLPSCYTTWGDTTPYFVAAVCQPSSMYFEPGAFGTFESP